ncbi:Arc family DNA-binding protein [Dyadobacter fanqingshengii]|uniref:Arc family DNA-binding protein n=1 Tax=Dyadobacter fanqingshengii TaxID=2906443 RepID=A0A9X1TI51_9BACT|nr:Arc family DNA-binding protein [Dyadobacter fanqingshengii]MCF0042442.1 Arc family DNA-binding protein [Dyadobacter fanqingshengii]MCF2506632.1 Arc family DNA-binding protein [Dyadobacter fanqingshengii]USJ35034.1 Arc family DNA-binding protein [Dyadobacter fanqingshengii]
MAEKKAFVLRVNPDMLKELEAWAQQDFRSLNGQIEFLLSEALKKQKRSKQKGNRPEEPD